MALLVPESMATGGMNQQPRGLGEALESLLEFIGAAAGWIGLRDPSGGLTFPVRRGDVPDSWLTLQQSRGSVWGFAVREGPTLINDLRPWPALGEPPLRNLLSCPLGDAQDLRGHVVLANKACGFSSLDAAVLQGMAHFMHRELLRQQSRPRPPVELPATWRRILDRASEGILIVDDAGALLYANATWLDWTGFRGEDLAGSLAPFPFWVSHHDLVRAIGMAGALPASALPFRRRDQSLFWCQVETVTEEWEGRRVTVAFLQQTTALAPTTRGVDRAAGPPPVSGELPFGVAVTDRHGRLLWANATLARLAPSAAVPGQMLQGGLPPIPAAVVEHILGQPRHAEPGRMGSLILPSGDAPLTLYWLAVRLLEGPGFLFALTDDADGFPLMSLAAPNVPLPASAPAVDWLALLLEPGGAVAWWDSRWEKLTGLSAQDVDGRCELALDLLFPQQRDRDRVADFLHHPRPGGSQAILDVTTPAGNRPLLCTFLPVPPAETLPGRSGEPSRTTGAARLAAATHWLLLIGEPELLAGPATPSWGFVRLFTRGLRQLLEHHLQAPAGFARLALARTDLPPEMAGGFQSVHDSYRRIGRLLDDLEDLSLATAGECPVVSLNALVREFLDEWTAERPKRGYDLRVDLGDEDIPVRVNPHLLRIVLGHLLTNAEQALTNGVRQIQVRVLPGADPASGITGRDVVRCEIHDMGGGLPVEEWTHVLIPFFSTKGAFAHDPVHAAQEATGLGLTVCRHLLALNRGHLELRSVPGEGTTAILTLPRADRLAEEATVPAPPESVRADPSSAPSGPHRSVEELAEPRDSPERDP